MRLIQILSVIVLMQLSIAVSGQDTKIEKLKAKNLTYQWVGKYPPNILNPELRYGFYIKYVGDKTLRGTTRNNRKVVRKINKVYGKDWFEENRLKL